MSFFTDLWTYLENNIEAISTFLDNFENFSIIYILIANTSYAFILFLGLMNSLKKHARSQVKIYDRKSVKNIMAPVSILVPCYNEEKGIIKSSETLLQLNYPNFEVIIVNDGSKDKSLERLIEHYDLESVDYDVPEFIKSQKVRAVYFSRIHSHLIVIDKDNGGKSDALNCGINMSNFPLICCVDGDGLIDNEGLIKMSLPFFEKPQKTIAVGGVIRVVNDLRIENGEIIETKIGWSYFSMIQIVEYLRAFLVGRMGWDYLGCNTIISGAFGLFQKKAVIEVGGYDVETIGEDMELLVRMEHHFLRKKIPYDVTFLPDPVCWTEVPTDFKTLSNQRIRWAQGLAQTIWKNKSMLFRPWAGRIGNFALPYLLIFELLSAPLEILSYFAFSLGALLGILDVQLFFYFIMVSVVYSWVLSLGAVLIEEVTFQKYKSYSDFFKLIIGSILEQLGFRHYHLYLRLKGIYRFFTKKSIWGEMKRSGF